MFDYTMHGNYWGDLPERLGMTVRQDGALVGRFGDHVTLACRNESTTSRNMSTSLSTADRWTTVFTVTVFGHMDSTLCMGLHLDDRGRGGGSAGVSLPSELAGLITLHPQGDTELQVRALSHVPPDLVQSAASAGRLVVTDASVMVAREDDGHNGYALLDDVDALCTSVGRLAEALVHARSRELASWEPPLRRAWAQVAHARGLEIVPPRAVLRGELGGLEVLASCIWESGYRTKVVVRPPEGLPHPWKIEAETRGLFGRLFGRVLGLGFEVTTGDREFDTAFFVQGGSIGALRRALDADARARLLALRRRTAGLRVRGGSLEVWTHQPVVDAAALEELLDACVRAVPGFTPDAPRDRGPFR